MGIALQTRPVEPAALRRWFVEGCKLIARQPLRTLSTVAVVLLAGCDSAIHQAAELAAVNEPTLVIGPSYQINVDGRVGLVQGFDTCPRSDPVMVKLFGPAPTDGMTTCVVLSKDRTTVPVLIALSTGTVREDWDIVRDTRKLKDGHTYTRTSLRRPDGSWVIPATNTHQN